MVRVFILHWYMSRPTRICLDEESSLWGDYLDALASLEWAWHEVLTCPAQEN